jgi:hypothetical protein
MLLDYDTTKKNIINYGNKREQNGFTLGFLLGVVSGSLVTLCAIYLIE